MDNFILNNDTWLRYLPLIIYGLAIVLAVLMIAIGFLIYRRYKNQNLKSRNRRSAFATVYADCFDLDVTSSVPIKRNNIPEPDTQFTHVHAKQVPPPAATPVVPVASVSDVPKPASNSGVIEVYFQYEDEYRI